MMNMQRLSTEPSPLLRSVIFAAGVVGLLAAPGSEGIQIADAASRKDFSTPSGPVEYQLAAELQLGSALTDDRARTDVAIAELGGSVAHAFLTLDKPNAVVDSISNKPPDVSPEQPAPVQLASVDPSQIEIGDVNRALNSVEIVDECLVIEICVDRYLWTLYQRTPKEDTIKVPERRKVSVKRKGKMVTVVRTFTKLVDQDFGWKDPKAAERVRLSMADYVIGGMDRSFKLKLFYMLHAADAAGLSPGITSAFRDDYRQSIASGLKAASNKSFHGGSSRGGYGHGLAADIVSIDGGSRNQRWASSDRLWKWVDANGKDFGIGRPYLGRDPPHVGPIDGREYTARRGDGTKQVASRLKKVTRVAMRNHSAALKRPRTAAVSKPKAS